MVPLVLATGSVPELQPASAPRITTEQPRNVTILREPSVMDAPWRGERGEVYQREKGRAGIPVRPTKRLRKLLRSRERLAAGSRSQTRINRRHVDVLAQEVDRAVSVQELSAADVLAAE